jgi:hypothetical protein
VVLRSEAVSYSLEGLFDVLVFDGLYFGLANCLILIMSVVPWSDEEEALYSIKAPDKRPGYGSAA